MREQFLVENGSGRELSDLVRLNTLFTAWVKTVYRRRVHSETGQSPLERWSVGALPALLGRRVVNQESHKPGVVDSNTSGAAVTLGDLHSATGWVARRGVRWAGPFPRDLPPNHTGHFPGMWLSSDLCRDGGWLPVMDDLATQIVDPYHAREHLHAVADIVAFIHGGPDTHREWLATQLEHLDAGRIETLCNTAYDRPSSASKPANATNS